MNTAYLNVRAGPGVGHGILTTLPGGTRLQVVSIASDGLWYQVATSSGKGWVSSRYTATRGSFAGVKREIDPRPSGATPRAVVNTTRLNIRSGPGIGHGVIASVPGGTILKVLGMSSGRGWYLVEGGFGQGWLSNHYTVFRGDFSQVRVVG